MKNRTENAQGKTGGAGGPAAPGYENLMDDAIRLAGTHPNAPTPPQGPSLGRCVTALLVAGPFALLGLLLGVCARLLSLPSALVYVVGYFAGWVAKAITLRIVGNPAPPPAPRQ